MLAALLITVGGCIAETWTTFRSADGEFEVEFPGEHKESARTDNDVVFGKLILRIITADESKPGKGTIVYMVMYCDYPDSLMNSGMDTSILEGHLEKAINEIVTQGNSTLVLKEKAQINGYPGKKIRVEYEKGTRCMVMKMYVVKNRQYLVAVTTDKNADSPDATDRFFRSFRLLK